MGQMARQEINIRRLLRICEAMAKDDVSRNWKLEKVKICIFISIKFEIKVVFSDLFSVY